MKNKKGFTLVELLAVIVILGLIAVIAIPNSMKVSDEVKKNLYCEKVDLLLTDAKRFGNDHLGVLRKAGDQNCYIPVTVNTLISKGVIKKEQDTAPFITNPYDGSAMDGKTIGIYYYNKRAYAFYKEDNQNLNQILASSCDNIETSERPTNACPNTLNFN
ncbi:MAG: prepilin-type N-terminal cleavage/methylation domain-containing protein [Bacilli bacterium]|nr:prepilin-type N-terminal cleavage/methylation domain-containing protein [Bacilli bacterium]